MTKNEFDNRPTLVSDESKNVLISFDIEAVKKEIPSVDGGEPVVREIYEAYTVRVEKPIERGKVIDAIICADYPNDVMQAVQNNYLADPEDKDAKAEMDAMQAWRVKAKQVADEVMAAVSAE